MPSPSTIPADQDASNLDRAAGLRRPVYTRPGPVAGRFLARPVVLSPACSKLKFERQLDRARSADLVERVESPISATGPQTVRQRLRRPTEERAGQEVGGITEVGVVQDVEELGSETKPHCLGDAKMPLHPDIRLGCS